MAADGGVFQTASAPISLPKSDTACSEDRVPGSCQRAGSCCLRYAPPGASRASPSRRHRGENRSPNSARRSPDEQVDDPGSVTSHNARCLPWFPVLSPWNGPARGTRGTRIGAAPAWAFAQAMGGEPLPRLGERNPQSCRDESGGDRAESGQQGCAEPHEP